MFQSSQTQKKKWKKLWKNQTGAVYTDQDGKGRTEKPGYPGEKAKKLRKNHTRGV